MVSEVKLTSAMRAAQAQDRATAADGPGWSR
jgi:hypothetical protein